MTILHPCLDENGKPVVVAHPSGSTDRAAWLDPKRTATLSRTLPPDIPEAVNGIAFSETVPVQGEDPRQWRAITPDAVAGEPNFVLPPGFRATSGCVVLEPDRRVWIVHPTNEFMGTQATFPKGRVEPVLSLAQNAVKETFEEAGIVVEPFAFLTDVARRIVVTRYYLARRTGGAPALAGWESQAVSLMPFEQAAAALSREGDQAVLSALKAYLESLG